MQQPPRGRRAGGELLRDIARGAVRAEVPSLWWYECTNLVRSAVLRGRLSESDARLAVGALRRLPVIVLPWAGEGALEILDLALGHRLSAYDAAYLHAAQAEACELYTADRDLLGLRQRFPWIRSLQDHGSAAERSRPAPGAALRRKRPQRPGRGPGR